MRITIVQTEIEEAIRKHILDQITVNDTMEIGVVLRATRGAEGYQADIDIRPKGSAASAPKATPEPEPQVEPEPTPEKPLAIEETVTRARRGRTTAPKAEEPTPEPEPAPESEAELAPEPAPEPVADEAPEAETEAAPAVTSIFAKKPAEPEAPAPEGQTQSIFGNLKRPVNAA